METRTTDVVLILRLHRISQRRPNEGILIVTMIDGPSSPDGAGLFVCLEGIDGCGKTTAIAEAGALLREQGWPVVSFDKKDVEGSSPYVGRHMRALRHLIWEHPPDDPYLELGDFHWVYLQAAWYSALAKCKVTPLLQAGNLVMTDTWTYKFLAKLRLRPDVDFDLAKAAFSRLPRPDLVIRLHIDPAEAAARKTSYSISEAGNHEGTVELSPRGFTEYQSRLSRVLEDFAEHEGWTTLDVSGDDIDRVGVAVATRVRNYVGDASTARLVQRQRQ